MGGFVRKLDVLGRIALPVELRRRLDLYHRDPMEIIFDDDKIILKKYKENLACHITGEESSDNLVLADGKLILSKEAADNLREELLKISLQFT